MARTPMRTLLPIFTTEPNETIIAVTRFKRGIVIATSTRLLYYGPKGDVTPIKMEAST